MVADLAAVIAFVVVGRSAHAHGLNPAGILSTAWPFLSGLVVGWLITRSTNLAPGRAGFVIAWLTTVALGMVLRVVAGQGTTPVFCVVATVFLGLFLLAGRAVLSLLHRRGLRPGFPSRP